jgi:cytochrome c553
LDALSAYVNGDRPHGTMHAQASTLSEADRQDIAAYFSDPAVCGKGR